MFVNYDAFPILRNEYSSVQDYHMQLSHLTQYDHDLHRGLNCRPFGNIVSNLIRLYHILMSIMIIGLILEKFLAAKKFSTIAGKIVTMSSDRMTS